MQFSRHLCVVATLVGIVVSLDIPAQGQSSERNTAAVEWCLASGAVEPSSFAYCVGGVLANAAINDCLAGRPCGGPNSVIGRLKATAQDAAYYGPECGGENSLVRKWGLCPKSCKGRKGFIHLENRTTRNLRPKRMGSCIYAEEGRAPIGPGQGKIVKGANGDQWIDLWAGGLGVPKPDDLKKQPDLNYAVLAKDDKPGRWNGHHWRLYHGLKYAVIENGGGQLAIINVTPRFGE